MKIAFAVPSYGPIDPIAAASQRAAILTAWTHGIQVRADIYVDRVAWEHSRNIVVKNFLDLGKSFDGIFWCDSDSVLPQEAIVDLVGPQMDVVTGIYHGRQPPYEPKIFVYKEETDSFFHIVRWPKTGNLFQVDGCGFGAVYTSRKALELTTQKRMVRKLTDHVAMKVEEVEETFWFKFDKFSEDLNWCHMAKQQGMSIWCNPGVEVGHLGEIHVVGAADREKFVENNPDSEVGLEFVPSAKAEEEKGPEEAPEHYSVTLVEDMRMVPSA